MKLVLHRRVRSDVDEIMDYFERAEHPELTESFYRELRGFLLDAARRPARYHFFKADLRRVNLQRFPYHFLYRVRRRLRARPRRPASPPPSRLRPGTRVSGKAELKEGRRGRQKGLRDNGSTEWKEKAETPKG